jgi:sugar O-acyltransferase (sialic acid O-acetyltransferase NeuD family)
VLIELSIVGAGGHSKVVIEAIKLMAPSCNVCLFDGDDQKVGSLLMGVEIQNSSCLDSNSSEIFVSIGDNKTRQKVSKQFVAEGMSLATIIHPTSSVAKTSNIARGTFVAALAVISADASIGEGSIVNHRAVVDHDCNIGEYVHVAPQATLGGGVSVGASTLIGSNATILPGITIGSNVQIGAGSVVTKDIADNQTVVGNPARIVKSE